MSQCPKCGLQMGLHHSVLPGCTCGTSAPFTYPIQPQKRQWVELTDDEARALVNRATFGDKTNWQALVYMVDAKLKEKNA